MTEWSPQQEAALKAVDSWYRNERHKKQVFRLYGWAGTGKTTLAKHFAQNIDGEVRFAAFTGKAAHVMASKGCPNTSTIHRLIYRPKIASKNYLKKLEEELQDSKEAPQPNKEVIRRIETELRKERENAGRVSFSLNLESELKRAKLLILDEVSMVNSRMGQDLESFGVPILALGDPEQLPPVFGQGHYTEQKPDIQLTEIHRQALDNPIIALSKIVREGGKLIPGTYGESRVLDTKPSTQDAVAHDIILVGMRETKKICDDKCRQFLAYNSPLPVTGDKVMCVKNNHNLNLLNGQIFDVLHPAMEIGDGIVSLHIKNSDMPDSLSLCASEKLFYGEKIDEWGHEEDIQEFEYSYAITVHKAQGSQWNNVFLMDQKDRFSNYTQQDRRRWLYTGITRAAERITIVVSP